MAHLPSLTAVRYFSVAATLGSFTAAAAELNVTQGAVSRMVQALERDLGVSLFARKGRFISLTSDGQQYLTEVREALRIIEAASETARRSGQDRPLGLIATTGFATRWLVSRLPAFRRLHPSVNLEILGNDPEDPGYAARADIIIRYGQPTWRNCSVTRLKVGTIGVVCAPDLLSSGALDGPADLLDRPLLTHTDEARDPWPEYFRHFGLDAPNLSRAPRFNQMLMLAEAAVSGQGFALLPLFLYEAELMSGRLVQAIPQTIESERGYYVTHAPGAEDDRKVRLFKTWLIAEAREGAPTHRASG